MSCRVWLFPHSFFLFCGDEDGTHGLTHSKYMLYHGATLP